MAVVFAFVFSKVSSFVEKHILNRLCVQEQIIVITIGTVLFEAGLVLLLAKVIAWSIIDSLFVASLLLLAMIWLPAYFRPYQENASRTVGKFHRGIHSGEIEVHKFGSMHPFFIGTLIFCAVGLLTVFGYYFSYFI